MRSVGDKEHRPSSEGVRLAHSRHAVSAKDQGELRGRHCLLPRVCTRVGAIMAEPQNGLVTQPRSAQTDINLQQ